MIQNIINFITNNAFLIIIIGGGLFNFAVRMAQKAKEQRAKREAAHEMDRRRQEALRTGHQVTPVKPKAAPVPDTRQERIEALRKERMEQLRALREKRAATSAQTSSSSAGQSHPSLPPFPVQTAGPQQAGPRRTSAPNQGQSPRPNVIGSTQQTTTAQRQAQQARAAAEFKAQFKTQEQSKPQQRRRVKKSKDVRQAAHVETLAEASNPSLHKTIHNKSKAKPSQTAREMLRSRSAVRQAMVLREILDAPLAMRDQDIASGSLY